MSGGRHSGFTLVEMIAVIAILGIIGSVASGLIFTASNAYADASATAQIHDEISIALDQAVRLLRDMPADASASGVAPDIRAIRARRVRWNGNFVLRKSGTDLVLRESGGPWRILQTDVTDFTVRSYDNDANLLPTALTGAECDPVRRLELELTVTRFGVSETLKARFYLRCTMAESNS